MKNYFMYDNNIISDAFLVVDITQTLLPDRNIEVLDILSRDGQVFNGSNYAPVEFDISILVSGESEYELQNNLRALSRLENIKESDRNQTEIKGIVAQLLNKYGYEELKLKLKEML